jgi:cis-3-alkyl-4-acyloxetan-2-one decarboxylase
MDIGDAGSRDHVRSLSLLSKLGVLAYQRRLAHAFRKAQKGQIEAADASARSVAKWVKVSGDQERVRAGMGWPYEQARVGAFKAARAYQFSSARPFLFLYGTRKPFMFHSSAWVAKVNATPGCQAHALDGGHWFMRGATQDRCQALVRDWLASSQP